MRLKDKSALITGGATGIGLACTRLFCREGARVAICGRRKDRLDEAVCSTEGELIAIQADITRKDDIDRLVDETFKAYQKVDILVNNAGIFTTSPIHEADDAHWDTVFDVNMKSVFQLTRKLLTPMMEQKSGSIIHISSILGIIAVPQTAVYNSSKGALIQFSRSIAVEYGAFGIRSNTVCPGLVETEMTEELMSDKALMDEWSKNYPIGRFGVPGDIANACLYLASDESSFVTGAVLPVDGGYTAN